MIDGSYCYIWLLNPKGDPLSLQTHLLDQGKYLTYIFPIFLMFLVLASPYLSTTGLQAVLTVPLFVTPAR